MSISTNLSIETAQANFAFNLIRETGTFESTILSPSSISVALGMILLGAKNNTAKEIQDAIAKGYRPWRN
uniref:Serpin domain-containing protein n=1 Tax=Panagrolaimus davidi TaxID=227884 RepID=A0A914PHX6_9BILA